MTYTMLLAFSAIFFYPLVVGIISFVSNEIAQDVVAWGVGLGVVFNGLLFILICHTIADSKTLAKQKRFNKTITITAIAVAFIIFTLFLRFISFSNGLSAFILGVINIVLTVAGIYFLDRM